MSARKRCQNGNVRPFFENLKTPPRKNVRSDINCEWSPTPFHNLGLLSNKTRFGVWMLDNPCFPERRKSTDGIRKARRRATLEAQSKQKCVSSPVHFLLKRDCFHRCTFSCGIAFIGALFGAGLFWGFCALCSSVFGNYSRLSRNHWGFRTSHFCSTDQRCAPSDGWTKALDFQGITFVHTNAHQLWL